MAEHARVFANFGGRPRFDIAADIGRRRTRMHDRTTTYLIDREGIVREVFPGLIHRRPDWRAVLNRIDELNEERGSGRDGDRDARPGRDGARLINDRPRSRSSDPSRDRGEYRPRRDRDD